MSEKFNVGAVGVGFAARARERMGALSPLFRYCRYLFDNKKNIFEKSIIIISVDIDVGNKSVGELNKGKNDLYINSRMSEYEIGRIEEQTTPLIINFFNNLNIPVTFAIRGQLLDVDSTIINMLLDSPIQHDIGSHSYYHRNFTKITYNDVHKDLQLVSNVMRKFNVIPKSFIYPKNRVAHLDLLEKFGYNCYRDYGDLLRDGRYIRKKGGLYDIHPGLYLGSIQNDTLVKKIINLSCKDKVPLHMWFHPWNLGTTKESVKKILNKVFYPIFKYIKLKEENDLIKINTMFSATLEFARGRIK